VLTTPAEATKNDELDLLCACNHAGRRECRMAGKDLVKGDTYPAAPTGSVLASRTARQNPKTRGVVTDARLRAKKGIMAAMVLKPVDLFAQKVSTDTRYAMARGGCTHARAK